MGSVEKSVRDFAIMEDEDEVSLSLQALQISTSIMISAMLKGAIDLDVFRIVAKAGDAGISAKEIVSEIPQEISYSGAVGRLDTMLCMLASHSLLTCSLRQTGLGHGGETELERIYCVTPLAKYFLPRDGRGDIIKSLAAAVQFLSHRNTIHIMSAGKDAILEEDSQMEKIFGMPNFQFIGNDPVLFRLYDHSMMGFSAIVMEEVIRTYKGFEGLSSLVDVGGGSGMCLNMIISKYPSIIGINFDLPHVIKEAPSFSGIKHAAGDMFVSVPQGDAIMFKEVLHNWDDEKCIKILKKSYEALPEDGKVIVIALIMPDAPDASTTSKFVTQLSTLMMLALQSHERTLRQFESLCKASGFWELRVACTVVKDAWAVMEFCK